MRVNMQSVTLTCILFLWFSSSICMAVSSDGENELEVNINNPGEIRAKVRRPRYATGDDLFMWRRTIDLDTGLPKVVVPYRITRRAKEDEDVILEAMKEWENQTCIKFREVPERFDGDSPFVEISKSVGCKAVYGRRAKTSLYFLDKCATKKDFVPKLGNVLGLFPENFRDDANDYLQYIPSHAIQNALFGKPSPSDARQHSSNVTHNVSYDYSSVLHPSGFVDSEHGKLTMVTKDIKYQGLLGRNSYLSHRDKLFINLYYECIDGWKMRCGYRAIKKSCQNEGFMGENCLCICRPGTTGDLCQNVIHEDYYAEMLPSCSRDIDQEITFATPNYPNIIHEGTWCAYKIKAPEDHWVNLKFNSFNFDCAEGSSRYTKSFLEIWDEENDYSGETLCGNDIEPGHEFLIKIQNVSMYMEIRSETSRGFEAEVTFKRHRNKTSTDTTSSIPSTTTTNAVQTTTIEATQATTHYSVSVPVSSTKPFLVFQNMSSTPQTTANPAGIALTSKTTLVPKSSETTISSTSSEEEPTKAGTSLILNMSSTPQTTANPAGIALTSKTTLVPKSSKTTISSTGSEEEPTKTGTSLILNTTSETTRQNATGDQESSSQYVHAASLLTMVAVVLINSNYINELFGRPLV